MLARIHDKLSGPEPIAAPESELRTLGQVINDESPDEPEPPRVEHRYGSTFRVRMSFDEVLAARGCGTADLNHCRRLVPPGDTQRQRDAASRRAGYMHGEVLWPSQ
ncbi:hypothetical protein [Mycobacterium sp. Lab-001]|uniref:hypothetical protein n=1 Tax=Mycobacterium sp. Lab-001 TaxID=3410136 RepID=UPI003D17AD56